MREDVKFGEYAKVSYNNEGLVICHICGACVKKLGQHAYMAHKITAIEYRDMFGLCHNTKLMCKESYELAKHNWEKYEDIQICNLNKGAEKRYIKGDIRLTSKRTLPDERLNYLKNNAHKLRKTKKHKNSNTL